MIVADVRKLNKAYPSFKLSDVSFSLQSGRIAGFIGRNGAGKTTTIKSMLNLVHPDSGEINCFGLPFAENESQIKQKIGYSNGGACFYPKKKIRDIVAITESFYPQWDKSAYEKYISLFELDENKAPCELSDGMRVKFNLLLALSHKAELLILDEPTSGLDPFSRDDLLRVFTSLKQNGTAILFSTHITSDIEKCADDIIYIKKGKIHSACDKQSFVEQYGRKNEPFEDIFLRLERGEAK